MVNGMYVISFILLNGLFGLLQGINQINIVGVLHNLDSLSRHTSSFVDTLRYEKGLRIQLFKNRCGGPEDLSLQCAEVFNCSILATNKRQIADYLSRHKPISGVVIYADPNPAFYDLGRLAPLFSESSIRIASQVSEMTEIDPEVIAETNAYCDAVIVPDQWLVDVYKRSGLTCPVFALPLALDVKPLLKRPIKKQRNAIFTYGFSGYFNEDGRKNHGLLMQAFADEFGGNSRMMLCLHGRVGHHSAGTHKETTAIIVRGIVDAAVDGRFLKVLERLNRLQLSNIKLQETAFTRQEYEDYLASLDCYVTISKGEGFSIIPREILAMGIPCIVSNNSAQSTICKSGCVRVVPSDIVERANPHPRGNWFNVRQDDVQKALRDVYQNYGHYLKLAHKGREWVKQYLPENLTKKYKMLVEPSRVLLGDRNEITDDYLMTDSPELFAKYKKLYSCNKKMQFHILGG